MAESLGEIAKLPIVERGEKLWRVVRPGAQISLPEVRCEFTGRKLLELPYRKPVDDVSAMELIDVVAAVRQRLATPVGVRR